MFHSPLFSFFFFNDTATTEIYTLSLHDALPIFRNQRWPTAGPVQGRPHSGIGAIAPMSRLKSENKLDRKSTRLNSSHGYISYAVFCLKKKKQLHTISMSTYLERVVKHSLERSYL